MNSRHVVTLHTVDEFAEHALAWDALLARSRAASVFLSSAWLIASYQALTPGAPFVCVLCYEGTTLLGGVALVFRDDRLIAVGDGSSDYLEVLIDQDASDAVAVDVVDAVCRHALEFTNATELVLRGVVEPNRLYERLVASTLYPVITRRTVAPTMHMSNAPEAMRKKSLIRHTNKLAKQGQLRVGTTSAAREVLEHLPAFFRQHQQRWASVGQPSQFESGAQRELFVGLTHALSASGALRFTTVSLDDRPVAFHFGMVSHQRFTWYKPTYDPEFAQFSPGEVLLRALIERAQSESVSEFDFTVGNEPFKRRFATDVRDVVDLVVLRSGRRAKQLQARISARELLKQHAPSLADRLRLMRL